MKKIADAFNVNITYFFQDFVSNPNYVVRQKEQKTFKMEDSAFKYTRLSGDFSGKLLEPMLVVMMPKQKGEHSLSHPGEEFYYVLKGLILFNIKGEEYLVREGDSIHFPSSEPHYYENILDEEALFLTVTTPVIF